VPHESKATSERGDGGVGVLDNGTELVAVLFVQDDNAEDVGSGRTEPCFRDKATLGGTSAVAFELVHYLVGNF